MNENRAWQLASKNLLFNKLGVLVVCLFGFLWFVFFGFFGVLGFFGFFFYVGTRKNSNSHFFSKLGVFQNVCKNVVGVYRYLKIRTVKQMNFVVHLPLPEVFSRASLY